MTTSPCIGPSLSLFGRAQSAAHLAAESARLDAMRYDDGSATVKANRLKIFSMASRSPGAGLLRHDGHFSAWALQGDCSKRIIAAGSASAEIPGTG
jgi:hypothetical protein